MTKPKKNTKKYNLSRSEVASRIEEIIDRLEKLDPPNQAPTDVTYAIESLATDLHDLAYEVTDEAV